jgi:hypothetical protein
LGWAQAPGVQVPPRRSRFAGSTRLLRTSVMSKYRASVYSLHLQRDIRLNFSVVNAKFFGPLTFGSKLEMCGRGNNTLTSDQTDMSITFWTKVNQGHINFNNPGIEIN